MKFVKKAVPVEAMQYTLYNNMERMVKFGRGGILRLRVPGGFGIFCNTHHGQIQLTMDDWAIRGHDGEVYPCKPDVFERTYERFDEDED